jgi:F420-non-reducing hydrogenase iron-sulfur subunit
MGLRLRGGDKKRGCEGSEGRVSTEFEPRMLGIICNWCCYGGADLCGVSRFQYPTFIRLVRVMCSAKADMSYVFRAFSKGLDAVFIGGCHLNDCHYVTNGNYDALGMVTLCKKVLTHIGIDPMRLRLEWVSAGEGIRFANIMNEYGAQIKDLGPLGEPEGLSRKELLFRLEAAAKIVPYIRLVQMERMRVSQRTEEGYDAFFASEDFERLFNETIIEKLELSRIMTLLGERPFSTSEISERLQMSSSEVSRHVKTSFRHGLIRYDANHGCYALA